MAIKGIDIIRRWVIQTRLKEQGKQGGVMITLPKKDFVDLNTSVTAEKLMRNGVDPNSITSVNQVENIINQINKPRVVSQGDPEFSGIMDRLMGSNVIKRDFGKPFKEEIEKMGSKELTDSPLDDLKSIVDDFKPMQTDDAIKTRIESGNKKGIANIQKKILEEDREIENLYGSAGFGKDQEIDAEFLAEYLAENAGKIYDDLPTMERLNFYDRAYNALTRYKRTKGTSVIDEPKKLDPRTKEKMDDMKDIEDPEDMATGGRAGFKMGRRAFLALMGGAGAGIGAAKTGLLKLFGQGAGKQVTKEIVKTPPVPGKPEWFDSLVNKVIIQGDDVTKKLSVQDRQVVHNLKIDNVDDVTVYRNLDDGQIRVSYDSPNNMGEQPVELVFKPGRADEVTKGKPADEFYAVEAEPRGVRTGPDDFDIEFDGENLASNVDELISDTSKLKQVATDKKPTMEEFVISKNKKDKTRAINEDQVEQAEYLETKYGPGPEGPDDFASGGIARMLGE